MKVNWVIFVLLVWFFNRFKREYIKVQSCLKKVIYRFRNILGEEVSVVEEKLENSGDENGETDHDGVAVRRVTLTSLPSGVRQISYLVFLSNLQNYDQQKI